MDKDDKRLTRKLFLGNVQIGGGAPVSVQSMTSTDTRDVGKTVAQIRRLERAGCEIVRVAVPDDEAAAALPAIRKRICIPLIADIHFQHRLALSAMAAGVEGIRINPGNMKKSAFPDVVRAARDQGTVIRIGVNAGSLEREVLARHGGPTAAALVESALAHIRLMEDLDFLSLKVSLKSSDVPTTISAYRLLADRVDYPLHLGVTEAGTMLSAAIKSALGIGALLHQGIGDTSGFPSPAIRPGTAHRLRDTPGLETASGRSGDYFLPYLRSVRDRFAETCTNRGKAPPG